MNDLLQIVFDMWRPYYFEYSDYFARSAARRPARWDRLEERIYCSAEALGDIESIKEDALDFLSFCNKIGYPICFFNPWRSSMGFYEDDREEFYKNHPEEPERLRALLRKAEALLAAKKAAATDNHQPISQKKAGRVMKKSGVSALVPASLPVLAFMLLFASAPADAALKSPYLDSLQRDFYIESCKSKLGDALKNPGCKAAPRLNAFIMWADSVGGARTNDEYAKAVKDRCETLTGAKRYAADIKDWPLIGEASSPLTVVMYFSGTCPLCKANFIELEREVVSGKLKGKVKIVAKPFGINTVNKALVAAHDMGRFSDFMHALAMEKGRIEDETIYEIASSMYFDRAHFKSVVESPSVAKRVDASYGEGKKNGVELVPTYIIGGRRYESVSAPRWIVDMMEYAIEAGK